MGFPVRGYFDSGFDFARRISDIGKKDLLIITSTPRHLNIERHTISAAKSRGAKVVCISSNQAVEMSALSDIFLSVGSDENYFINSFVPYVSLCNLLITRIYERDKAAIEKRMAENAKFLEGFDLY